MEPGGGVPALVITQAEEVSAERPDGKQQRALIHIHGLHLLVFLAASSPVAPSLKHLLLCLNDVSDQVQSRGADSFTLL